MNMFDSIFFSIIMLLFPVLCYLFYIVANKNIDEKQKLLVLNFTLLSVYYLIKKNPLSMIYTFLLTTIPIFLIYKKTNRFIPSILCIITLIFSFLYNQIYFYFLAIQLIIIIFINYKKSVLIYYFTTIFTVLIYTIIFDINSLLLNILYCSYFVILSQLVFYTIKKGEEVINYHIEYKDLKKENEIRKSLFKITHEIKNPLAVCKAYIDMFDYNDIECAKKYIPILSSEMDKMLLLLQDFLLVNKDNINFDIMDINILLEETIDSMLDLKRFNIDFENEDDDEIFINGDYNRLSQVMTNLIKNSYEANASSIIVKSYRNNNQVVVEVIDNGDGITEEVYKRIYEPFYTTKRDGTGLGVSLSSEIIEAHMGTLKYYNNTPKGTVAKIMLPIQEI